MDLLWVVVARAHEPALPAEDSNQAAMEQVLDPDRDRSDRKVSLVEFQVFLCSSFFSAQTKRRKETRLLISCASLRLCAEILSYSCRAAILAGPASVGVCASNPCTIDKRVIILDSGT